MRSLTLLELMVEWESIPLSHFIVVWLPVPGANGTELYPRWWQKICITNDRKVEQIHESIRNSGPLNCEIHVDPAFHYGWKEPSRACNACMRPYHEHFTDTQIAAISAAVMADAIADGET